jgi:dTDP-4-dehydrorhamnose reductase
MTSASAGNKVFITGASGMLGKDIAAVFAADETYEVYGASRGDLIERNNVAPVRLDINDTVALKKTLELIGPDIIVHCAAIVNVDRCEENKQDAERLHVLVTKTLAGFRAEKTKFVYISTDSVFDGIRGAYKETDEAKPLNYYALTKFWGEQAALAENVNSLVIRTNIYGFHLTAGSSLVEWALSNLEQNKTIDGFDDVIFNPIYTKSLAVIVKNLLEIKNGPTGRITGILNIGSDRYISKYDFLRELAKTFGLEEGLINKSSVDTVAFKAKRPKNTSLDVAKLKGIIGSLPDLKSDLEQLKKDITINSHRDI